MTILNSNDKSNYVQQDMANRVLSQLMQSENKYYYHIFSGHIYVAFLISGQKYQIGCTNLAKSKQTKNARFP